MALAVIDPGHGGTTKVGGSRPNNAKEPSGLLEKTVALDLALRVRTVLKKSAIDVVLTRDAGADAFVIKECARDRNLATPSGVERFEGTRRARAGKRPEGDRSRRPRRKGERLRRAASRPPCQHDGGLPGRGKLHGPHPHGELKRVSLDDTDIFTANADGAVIHYTSDTEPGSSGAPVIDRNARLIALHHAALFRLRSDNAEVDARSDTKAGRIFDRNPGLFRFEGIDHALAARMDALLRQSRG